MSRPCEPGQSQSPCWHRWRRRSGIRRPAPVASINIGSATGTPGAVVHVDVTLDLLTMPLSVIATSNDFDFKPEAPVARGTDGRPACAVNPDIQKDGFFTFLPEGCTGTACTGVSALVIPVTNSDPIPDDTTLYTCTIEIADGAAPGSYELESGLSTVMDSDHERTARHRRQRHRDGVRACSRLRRRLQGRRTGDGQRARQRRQHQPGRGRRRDVPRVRSQRRRQRGGQRIDPGSEQRARRLSARRRVVRARSGRRARAPASSASTRRSATATRGRDRLRAR